MKSSLVIASPYLKNVGGTEMEAVSTAVILWDTGKFSKIHIFSPEIANKFLFKEIIGNRPIKFIAYPKLFSFSIVKKINGLFKKAGLKFNIFEYLYWKIYVCYDIYFIITNVRNTFFSPIVNTQSAKNIIIKIAMYHYEKLNSEKRKDFEKSRHILVFNNDQKIFWNEHHLFSNVKYLDVITPNERNLLLVENNNFEGSRNLIFGYMGRISKEKNLEDMILLLNFLNNVKNENCELHICGVGEELYVEKIRRMIQSLKLSQYISFENSFIHPTKTHHFFEKIDVFLVTSLHEGGPITSLQAAATGRPVLGYDVGAMKDRFSQAPNSVNHDFEELCLTAYSLVKSSESYKVKLGEFYRNIYKEHLNNEIKINSLLKLFDINAYKS